MAFERVTVLGVGLIGGSLARAMKKRKLCKHVVGHGRNEKNLGQAKELGIIDSYELDPASACDGSDLIVFATPVETFMSLAEKVSGALQKGALAIDVGSLKGIVYEMEKRMAGRAEFVGCHPIAGNEGSGIEASSPELFEGALCIITRTEKSVNSAVEKTAGLWTALGCRVEYLSPEEHDRVYGLVSHFPHLAAYAMLNTAGDVDPGYLRYAGPGFKDTTRISLSAPALWRNICLMNRDNIIEFIDVFTENLEKLRGRLEDEDSEGLDADFSRARALRESIER